MAKPIKIIRERETLPDWVIAQRLWSMRCRFEARTRGMKPGQVGVEKLILNREMDALMQFADKP